MAFTAGGKGTSASLIKKTMTLQTKIYIGLAIAAIFAIGKKKGHAPAEVKAWVTRRLNKSIDDLTSREASHLIGDLDAL